MPHPIAHPEQVTIEKVTISLRALASMMAYVTRQQKANRVKKRKLRALRKSNRDRWEEIKMLRAQLNKPVTGFP